MKILFFILLFTTSAFAQFTASGIIVKGANTSKTTVLRFPHDTSKYLRGDSSWATVSGGTANTWYVGDASTTPVQAPSVTVGTKGLAAGDSAIASGLGSMSLGNNSQALKEGALNISTCNRVIGANIDSELFSIMMTTGAFNVEGSSGSVLIGYNVADACTINSFGNDSHGNVNGGYNTIIGGNAANNGTVSNFNTIIGYSATVNNGRSNVAIGDGALITGSSNINLGSQTGVQDIGTAKSRINIYSQDTTFLNNISSHDSTTIINGIRLRSRNADEYMFGAGNLTGSNFLFQWSDGGRHGNASTFDVLSGSFSGVVTAGNSFVAGAALGGATTPTNGAHFIDNVIYAWGDVAANGTVNSQYGNCAISNTGAGTYTITLPTTLTKAVCNVTVQAISFCYTTYSAGVFTVHTALGTIASPTATNEPFYFIVTGRP